MKVKRIVSNIATKDVSSAYAFYGQLLGLEVVMDHGWIVTLASDHKAPVQVNIASEGGSGTEVPDLSIEVEDVDEVYARAKDGGFEITYELTDEPWGIRRFYVRDPFGQVVNISSHIATL